jgi:hypothetical protein
MRRTPPLLVRRRCACWLLGLLLCTAAPSALAQTATVRGFVTDSTDGQPLQDVNVVLENTTAGLTGTATGRDGYYQLGGLAPGTYALRVTSVGYAPVVDTLVLAAGALVTRSIALVPRAEALEEVVVETEGGPARVEGGLQRVRPGDLARIPTPDGGGDLASYLQTLPGVVALGDRGGQLFVRGGTPTQNLVLMDGMLVYQPFHIIGFFSAFPEDLVSYADVYAGGFGARYSNRLSSVIDVAMRSGNKQRFAAAASAAPFLTSLRVEGPISRGRLSFVGAVRESVIEQTAPALVGDALPFHFGDQFGKLHAQLGPNHQLSFTALHTFDRGTIGPEDAAPAAADAVRWENTVAGLRFLTLPRTIPILGEFLVSTSYVENVAGAPERPERSASAQRFNLEAHITHFAGDTRLNWGLYARTLLLEYALGGLFQNLAFDDISLVEAGLYGEAVIHLGDRLRLSPGVAVNSFPTTFNTTVEPRLRVTWRPAGDAGRHQLSAAWGLYRQGITGVSDERDAGSVFVAWLPTPSAEPNETAMHALLGWQMAALPGLTLGVEGYYKRLRNLAVPAWSALARFTTQLISADGTAYGLDARAEWQRGPFYLYAGYGFSVVEYEGAQDNFGLWFGEPVQQYHPPHDRRHQLNLVASAQVAGFEASVRWQYGSGLPYTRPYGFDNWIPLREPLDVRTLGGTYRLIYDRPYDGRLPAYHRLDVSVERRFRLGWGSTTLQAGVINAYDRANLFYLDLFTARRVDQLPLVPFAGLKIEVE